MDFWRTLFGHKTSNPKPTYPVTPVTSPTTTQISTSASPIPFQTLVFSSTAFVHGTPSTGTINNATGGSIIVPVGLPAGLTINSSLRTWAWDGTGSVGTGSFQLYENIPGASTNPNISVISYTIAPPVPALKFNVPSDSQYLPIVAF